MSRAALWVVPLWLVGCSPPAQTVVAGCGPPSLLLSTSEPTTPSPQPPPLALRLNVPAYRLDVLRDGTRSRSYRVAVGTPDHPTPRGGFQVQRITWNPWWIPPPFEWAARDRPTPPGPDNPTGRVKLFFATYLFLHGTPAESTLGHAASHGCVRMANSDAIELARLVHEVATPGVPTVEIDSLVADPDRTRTYSLDRPVRLTIEYRLAELQRGSLLLYPDIYGLGALDAEEVLRRIEEEGVPAESLDSARLEDAIEAASRETVQVPLRELLPKGPGRE